MFDLKRIEATLKYGPFDNTKQKYVIIFFVILNVLLVGGLIGIIYYLCFEQICLIRGIV